MREGIYSILRVEGLQAKPFNTQPPSGTILLISHFLYDYNASTTEEAKS